MGLVQIVEENRAELWDTNGYSDIKTLFKKYVKEESINRGIVINDYWLSMMNHENHNSHLPEDVYKKALKEWERFLNKTSYKWFIKNVLKGKKVDCEVIRI